MGDLNAAEMSEEREVASAYIDCPDDAEAANRVTAAGGELDAMPSRSCRGLQAG
jgi:hypothetical protein